MQGVFRAFDFDAAAIPRAGLASTTKLRELLCKHTQALIKMRSGQLVVAHSVAGGGRGRPRIRVAVAPEAEPEEDGLTAAPWSMLSLGEMLNWECIILGAVGGEFKAGNRTAKVHGVVLNRTGSEKAAGGSRRRREMGY